MDRKLVVRRLGRVEYEDGLALMQALAKARDQGRAPDTLLLLEHPPVLTMGRAAKAANVLLSPDELAAKGVEVFETDRGGDVTYHGPGQLVGYPIFDLKPDRQDVRRYVRGVEEAMIRTLAGYGITAGRVPKWTGVWVGGEEDPDAVKICAIGIHIKKWITTHGFALNVMPDLSHFGMIVPCGIAERGVSSMSQLLGKLIDPDEVAVRVAREFGEVFEWPLEERGFDLRTISVAVLREGRSGPEVLLLRRTPERGGFEQIVTGRIEAGEDAAHAAARELGEETGLSVPVTDLRYIHAFGFGDEPLFVQEHAFAAWAPRDAAVRIDPAEHVSAAWLPLEEAKAAVPFRGLRRAIDLALRHRPV
ncbi:lipoyl(octanoyl) transferase LipB [Vulgatibacter incomptus]|uniref:Octanoyltransferase n=1 Tax=Vulgatibacter incomptus TaxID=1391653 RepID=A0A0K1PE13_9BACT|nr:lipoyl(octanoyl) transferase LipB [Vulgatibacter incomptus]AKU91732.1 Octanoate-[acyl-carrier-protein]-protein-N-octanoyltransferase [Vulgatibacter incomptus]